MNGSFLAALLLLLSILRAETGEILYEDKFTNLDPSWGMPGERLSVEDGKLTLKPAPDTTQSVLNQANVFTDADINVDIILPAGDVSVPGGLIFWAKDLRNFYCLCIDAAGYFKISRYVTDRWLQPVGWIENAAVKKGIAVAGTATSLAAIAQHLEPYDPSRVHGYVLTATKRDEIFARLADLPLDRRREVRGLHPDRAISILPGIVILTVVMNLFGLYEITVSEHDILRGAALTYARSG